MPQLDLNTKKAGIAQLRSFDIHGVYSEFEKLVEAVRGHAFTLHLVGVWLRDFQAGDIRRWELLKLEKTPAAEPSGHIGQVMDAYMRWEPPNGLRARLSASLSAEERRRLKERHRAISALRLLGLFHQPDRPATADCLAALLKAPMIPGLTEALADSSESEWSAGFAALEAAGLATVNRDARGALLFVEAHPLLRDYLTEHLREQREAWLAGHRRLYLHLCAATKEGAEPTLEDLRPLYQAVAHGCLAGMQAEAFRSVYFARIVRQKVQYSLRKLAAFGPELDAIACFFDEPWSRVSTSLGVADQCWLLGQAGSCLHALGRQSEALAPMRAALVMRYTNAWWTDAAINANNLSELELTLGLVSEAVRDGGAAVAYADYIGDKFLRLTNRATSANARRQAGRRADAEKRFRVAEQIQAKSHPSRKQLHSLPAFQYCDLLLDPAERAAWRVTLGISIDEDPAPLLESCRAVAAQAVDTIKIAEKDQWSLAIALGQLTLERAMLYQAILEDSSLDHGHAALQDVVAELRRTGMRHWLPGTLLTNAWWLCQTGATATASRSSNFESARRDLDEVWEITQSGPMRLHLADLHLCRARLFFREAEYPWKSAADDLAAAEELITQCGYGRRQEELADARRAILGGETA